MLPRWRVANDGGNTPRQFLDANQLSCADGREGNVLLHILAKVWTGRNEERVNLVYGICETGWQADEGSLFASVRSNSCCIGSCMGHSHRFSVFRYKYPPWLTSLGFFGTLAFVLFLGPIIAFIRVTPPPPPAHTHTHLYTHPPDHSFNHPHTRPPTRPNNSNMRAQTHARTRRPANNECLLCCKLRAARSRLQSPVARLLCSHSIRSIAPA